MKTIIKLFVIGAISHVVFWVAVINYYSEQPFAFVCSETSCWVLLIADFPVMIFASDGSVETLSKMSLIFGTLWWGILFVIIGSGWIALIHWATQSNKTDINSDFKKTIQVNNGEAKGYLTCNDCGKTFYAEDCTNMHCPECNGTLKP